MIRNGDIVCILISINIRKCNNRNLHSFTVNSNQRNHGINSNKFLKNYSCIKKIYCKVYYIKNKMKSQKIKRSIKRIISLTFSLSGESTLFLHLSRAYLQAGVLVSIYGPPLSQRPKITKCVVAIISCLTF